MEVWRPWGVSEARVPPLRCQAHREQIELIGRLTGASARVAGGSQRTAALGSVGDLSVLLVRKGARRDLRRELLAHHPRLAVPANVGQYG